MKKITINEFNDCFESFCYLQMDYDFMPYIIRLKNSSPKDLDTFEERLMNLVTDINLLETTKLDIINYINSSFEELFLLSHNKTIFFEKCSFTVFELTFESRFLEYKNINVDANLIDFTKAEYNTLEYQKKGFEDHFNSINEKRVFDSYVKKREFLETIFLKENIIPKIEEIPLESEVLNYKITYHKTRPQQPESEPLDLSDTSAVQRIIYLNELGIIDFLRTKAKVGISNGELASLLSAITGVKANTIKPSLNRLDKNDIDDNKHPYYKTDNVNKIKKRIEDLRM